MKVFVALVVVVVLSLLGWPAWGDEVAPELQGQDLRVLASRALGGLERGGVMGVYVAFDPDSTNAIMQAACDDDGDPVVVVSDAMLRLVERATELGAYDRANNTHTVAAYASYLAQQQAPGKRLLVPPPGIFAPGSGPSAKTDDVSAALAFLIARELEHHRARDVVCPHPTATTEIGDAVWTSAEQNAARATARSVYPGAAAARDEAALKRLRSRTFDEAPALDVLALLAAFEAEHAHIPARIVPSYVTTHPGSAARASTMKATAPNASAL